MKKIITLIIMTLLITSCSINKQEQNTQKENETLDYYEEKYKEIKEYLITSYDFYTSDTINIDDNNKDINGYIYYVITSSYKNNNKNSITKEELQNKVKYYFGIENFEYINSDYNSKKEEYDLSNIKYEKNTKTIFKELIIKEEYKEIKGEVILEDNTTYNFIITIDNNNHIKKIYSKI